MQQDEKEFSFYDLFVPLTIKKSIVFISVIGVMVFFNMLFNHFVWDDKTYILFNPDVVFFHFFALIRANLFNAGGQYRPIPALYFALLYAFFRQTPFFYHLLQLVIHITNTSLIFLLFTKFFSKKIALMLSFFYLLHPIQVESVSFIAASDNPLFFLFGMLAFLISIRASTKRQWCLVSFFMLLCLLTKESGVIFLLMIFLFQFLFKREASIQLFIAEGIAFLLYCFIRFIFAGVYFSKLPLIPIARLTLLGRIINIPDIIFYYIKTFLFPLQLAIDQQWVIQKINLQSFYFPLIVDTVFFSILIFFGIQLYRRQRDIFKQYLFFFSWFVFGLGLYLQIFPIDGTVADRWFYFPLVGLLGLLGILGRLRPMNKMRLVGYSSLTCVFILLSFITIMRNANWINGITLFSHDRQISDNFDIENNLATEYAIVKDYNDAIIHSQKSIQLFPYEANLYNLADTYEQMGDKENAKKYFTEALAAKNYLPIGHNHFEVTYSRFAYLVYSSGDIKSASIISKKGLQEYPQSGELWLQLAMSEYKLGNKNEALVDAKKANEILANNSSRTIYFVIEHNQQISE